VINYDKNVTAVCSRFTPQIAIRVKKWEGVSEDETQTEHKVRAKRATGHKVLKRKEKRPS